MQKTPRFSIIIPTLNEEKFVGNLLASLAAQTQRDFEVLVVDGRSKDKTLAVVTHYQKQLPQLTIIQSHKALLPLQRNLGAQKARGEWFVFIDADSVLLPYSLERFAAFIQEEHPEFFAVWFRPDSEGGSDAILTLLGNFGLESSVMLHREIAPGILAVVNSKAHRAVGGYDESYRFGEDADYGRRLAEAGFSLRILRETLVVCSLRRFRREGTLGVLRTYARAAMTLILTRRPPKFIPGYIMGGSRYLKNMKRSLSALRRYELKMRRILKKLFV